MAHLNYTLYTYTCLTDPFVFICQSVCLHIPLCHESMSACVLPPCVCSDGLGLATTVSAPGEQRQPGAREGGTVAVNCLTQPSVYTSTT